MPPLATSLAVSLLVSLAGALLVLRRIPPRWACPRCHHATSPVRSPWLRPIGFWFERRWCTRCLWSGIARRRKWVGGGGHEPGVRPSAHPSGFSWRSPRRRTDGVGFRWGA